MNPQIAVPAGIVLGWLAGLGASRGILTKEQAAYIASPETLAAVCTFIGGVLALYGWWKARPPAVVKAAADIVAKDGGAIIASPKMADEKLANVPNVVSTVAEASNVVRLDRAA